MKHLLTQSLLALALAATTFAQTPVSTPAPAPTPNTAIIPSTRNDWMDTHVKYVETAKKGDLDIFFIGDSITIGWTNSKSGGPVWDKTFRPMKAAAFGIGGDRTENVLWRIQNGLFAGPKPKLAVLMIGTNNLSRNSPPQIADGVTAIVREIQKLSPDTKILLLGIFPRGAQAGNEERRKIAQINDTIARLDDGKSVFYKDIGTAFLEPDGTLTIETSPDLLHFSTKGYQIWADAISGTVNDLLGVKPTPSPAP